jgi:hypothetical protein
MTKATKGLNRKMFCRSRIYTHKIREMNRVKIKNLIQKMCAGLEGSPELKNCAKITDKRTKKYEQQKHIQNLSAVVATAIFQQKKQSKSFEDF